MDVKVMNEAADNIRVLITQMVEKAKSGHPGGAMGAADFINVLYSRFLVYDPEDPTWFARDRFFLDPGHMSPMLYSVLALCGNYTIDDLRDFRQWGSITPGHPEKDFSHGIENTSGPLGQGHVMAVGAAIAERFLVAKFGDVVAHKTYAFISDGGIQEEISQGAGRIAGLLGLHNLIMFYDANEVQLSTRVEDVTGEDTAAKYRAWGWNVLDVDGCDPVAIAGALMTAIEEREKPTLIIGRTVMARKVIGKDGGSMEGAVSTHGQPLSAAGADIEATVRNLGGDPDNAWIIRDEVRKLYDDRKEELRRIVAARREEYLVWAEENPELAKTLRDYIELKLPAIDWDAIGIKPGMASRAASYNVLNYLADHIGNMIVSSADLCNSDKSEGWLKKTGVITKDSYGNGFIQAGVAELTMACLINGIALHGGVFGACATFFVFSDYMKPAIRMSALMGLPVKFIYSHDSFRVGEDGPTHEPIEQEAQLRMLEQIKGIDGKPSMLVLRPADAAETIVCYKLAMENLTTPTALIFSRQNLEDVPGENRREEAWKALRGGYAVYDVEDPDIVLVANGSDVVLLYHAAEQLAKEGVKARVLSIPSIGLFKEQDKEYRDALLPDGVKIFALTSGIPTTMFPLMKGEYEVMGLERFGASAPAKVLEEKFGYNVPVVLARIKEFMGR
ncbi:MAG: transketolase [Muribaculaceae bacterium]|nr:transketolase [Muribaculaceae bacterium]